MTWWLAMLIFSSIVTGFASARWIEHYAARQRLEVARRHEQDAVDFLRQGAVYQRIFSDEKTRLAPDNVLTLNAPAGEPVVFAVNGDSLITTTESTVTVDLPAIRRLAIGKTLEWKE